MTTEQVENALGGYTSEDIYESGVDFLQPPAGNSILGLATLSISADEDVPLVSFYAREEPPRMIFEVSSTGELTFGEGCTSKDAAQAIIEHYNVLWQAMHEENRVLREGLGTIATGRNKAGEKVDFFSEEAASTLAAADKIRGGV